MPPNTPIIDRSKIGGVFQPSQQLNLPPLQRIESSNSLISEQSNQLFRKRSELELSQSVDSATVQLINLRNDILTNRRGDKAGGSAQFGLDELNRIEFETIQGLPTRRQREAFREAFTETKRTSQQEFLDFERTETDKALELSHAAIRDNSLKAAILSRRNPNSVQAFIEQGELAIRSMKGAQGFTEGTESGDAVIAQELFKYRSAVNQGIIEGFVADEEFLKARAFLEVNRDLIDPDQLQSVQDNLDKREQEFRRFLQIKEHEERVQRVLEAKTLENGEAVAAEGITIEEVKQLKGLVELRFEGAVKVRDATQQVQLNVQKEALERQLKAGEEFSRLVEITQITEEINAGFFDDPKNGSRNVQILERALEARNRKKNKVLLSRQEVKELMTQDRNVISAKDVNTIFKEMMADREASIFQHPGAYQTVIRQLPVDRKPTEPEVVDALKRVVLQGSTGFFSRNVSAIEAIQTNRWDEWTPKIDDIDRDLVNNEIQLMRRTQRKKLQQLENLSGFNFDGEINDEMVKWWVKNQRFDAQRVSNSLLGQSRGQPFKFKRTRESEESEEAREVNAR